MAFVLVLLYSNNHRFCPGQSGNRLQWGAIFRTHSDHPLGPLSFLWHGYRVFFTRVKRPESGFDHIPPFGAEVEERLWLYLYSLPGPSWPVVAWNVPYLLYVIFIIVIQKSAFLFLTMLQLALNSSCQVRRWLINNEQERIRKRNGSSII